MRSYPTEEVSELSDDQLNKLWHSVVTRENPCCALHDEREVRNEAEELLYEDWRAMIVAVRESRGLPLQVNVNLRTCDELAKFDAALSSPLA